MKIKELKDRSVGELQKLLGEQREILRSLRFQVSTAQESHVHRVSDTKKTIARILTLLKEKASAS